MRYFARSIGQKFQLIYLRAGASSTDARKIESVRTAKQWIWKNSIIYSFKRLRTI